MLLRNDDSDHPDDSDIHELGKLHETGGETSSQKSDNRVQDSDTSRRKARRAWKRPTSPILRLMKKADSCRVTLLISS